jgi:hypothetical protein
MWWNDMESWLMRLVRWNVILIDALLLKGLECCSCNLDHLFVCWHSNLYGIEPANKPCCRCTCTDSRVFLHFLKTDVRYSGLHRSCILWARGAFAWRLPEHTGHGWSLQVSQWDASPKIPQWEHNESVTWGTPRDLLARCSRSSIMMPVVTQSM